MWVRAEAHPKTDERKLLLVDCARNNFTFFQFIYEIPYEIPQFQILQDEKYGFINDEKNAIVLWILLTSNKRSRFSS